VPSDRVWEADWYSAGLNGFGGRVDQVIPRGYPAYARILHPARTESGDEVRWSDVATWSGTVLHPLAQFQSSRFQVAHGCRQRILVPADPLGVGGELEHLVEPTLKDVVRPVRLVHTRCRALPRPRQVSVAVAHREPTPIRRSRMAEQRSRTTPEPAVGQTPFVRVLSRPPDRFPSLVLPPARNAIVSAARLTSTQHSSSGPTVSSLRSPPTHNWKPSTSIQPTTSLLRATKSTRGRRQRTSINTLFCRRPLDRVRAS
jgi:hypothetical protein